LRFICYKCRTRLREAPTLRQVPMVSDFTAFLMVVFTLAQVTDLSNTSGSG
jgi:hypothetical protein